MSGFSNEFPPQINDVGGNGSASTIYYPNGQVAINVYDDGTGHFFLVFTDAGGGTIATFNPDVNANFAYQIEANNGIFTPGGILVDDAGNIYAGSFGECIQVGTGNANFNELGIITGLYDAASGLILDTGHVYYDLSGTVIIDNGHNLFDVSGIQIIDGNTHSFFSQTGATLIDNSGNMYPAQLSLGKQPIFNAGVAGSFTANGTTGVAKAFPGATVNSIVFFSLAAPGGTLGMPYASGLVAGTGFTFKSTSALDTSTYNFFVVN